MDKHSRSTNNQSANGHNMANPFSGYYYYPTNMQPPQTNREYVMRMREQEADKIVPKKHGVSWGSIILKPNLVFETQNPDEKVYVLVRAHWITNLGWILKNLALILLPFIVSALFLDFNIQIDLSFLSNKAATILALIYYSFIFTDIVSHFIDWYFDPFIVTDQRIMDYDYKPFSSYSVSEVNLQDIQEVKERSAGIVGDIFNYGNVLVYSASDRTEMVCLKVPSPTKVRDIITDLSNVAKTYKYDNL